jgi:hypothetical protein
MEKKDNIALWLKAMRDWNRWLDKNLADPVMHWAAKLGALIAYLVLWIAGQALIVFIFVLRHMLKRMFRSGDTALASLYAWLLFIPTALIVIRIVGVAPIDRLSDETPLVNLVPSKSTNNYVNEWNDVAREKMREHGIPASITLAQGILESGNGMSRLTRESRNHFGIKCGGGWRGERVYENDDRPKDCFRKYGRDEDSFEDHSRFLEQSRYKALFDLPITDYRAWAYGLKAAGYATDPNYPKKLIKLIERYKLYEYDK